MARRGREDVGEGVGVGRFKGGFLGVGGMFTGV